MTPPTPRQRDEGDELEDQPEPSRRWRRSTTRATRMATAIRSAKEKRPVRKPSRGRPKNWSVDEEDDAGSSEIEAVDTAEENQEIDRSRRPDLGLPRGAKSE